MFAHVIDHFVLTSRILAERTKWIVYGTVIFSIVANFWWFRGMAFGIDGPIKDYWGVQWRQVSCYVFSNVCVGVLIGRFSHGTSMICRGRVVKTYLIQYTQGCMQINKMQCLLSARPLLADPTVEYHAGHFVAKRAQCSQSGCAVRCL
jgi:hypothetical protein